MRIFSALFKFHRKSYSCVLLLFSGLLKTQTHNNMCGSSLVCSKTYMHLLHELVLRVSDLLKIYGLTYAISLSFAKNVSAAPTWAGLPVSDLLKIWRLNTYVRFFSALLKLNRNTIMWSPASLVWSISLKFKARLIHGLGWFYLSFSLYTDFLALSQNSLRIRHGGFSLLYSK